MRIERWRLLFLVMAIAALRAAEGRPPPADDPARAEPAENHGRPEVALWSWQPLAPGEVPLVRQQGWIRNEIDRYVLARLEAAGLPPAPAAHRHALVRRLHFDLTGLPPDPGVMAAVVADPSPDAVERLVDELLASPRFGEHWARWWLDVVRYSDSNGFDWDEFRPEAWRFRDYVIRAFNADRPFDRFLTEQLAGDELVDGPPRDETERDALIATGYLRIGPQDNSAKLFNEEDRARHELLSDLTETTAAAFLALTLSCCRCHDHKTEPLTQADHFRFRAFFEAVAPADDLPIDLAAEQSVIRDGQARVDALIRPWEDERKQVLAGARDRLVAEGKKMPSDDDVRRSFTEAEAARDAELGRQMEAVTAERPRFTKGLLMTERPDAREQPAQSFVLAGGDHRHPRDAVPAGFPGLLDPRPAVIVDPPNPRTTGRRLTLARWLTRADHPLTSRVYVNRVWQALFGQGLVATPNDFGFSGDRPSHPELLDWLARRFMEDGWSTKRLVRTVVLSATYQQAVVNPGVEAVAADPALWWRQSLRRLSAEQIRDAQLAVSGRLRLTEGGPPVWPELPREVLTANPAFLDDNAEKTKGWYPSPPEMRPVRSVFLVQKRTVRIPFMETFDLPENATSCGRRTLSTVAPQALTLLNGSLTEEVAAALAGRIQAAAGDDDGARVVEGFRLALQRPPSAEEDRRCREFLAERSLEEWARVLINLNEFVYLD